jgi:acetate kinase
MQAEGLTIDQFQDLVNRESGLLGISETSPDLRDLLSRQDADVRASEAFAVFCGLAKTAIGPLAAALGGLDTLAFTGGIGENSPEARRRIFRRAGIPRHRPGRRPQCRQCPAHLDRGRPGNRPRYPDR